MKIKKIFYDLETTGLSERKNSIHQISGIFEIDGEIVEEFNFHVKPHPKAEIEIEALVACGVTRDRIMGYPDMKKVYPKLKSLLDKYINKYNKLDKAHLIGFNNRYFDDRFLSAWFTQNGDNFLPSYVYFGLDVSPLAAQFLMERRPYMPSFKLKRVAIELGINVDEKKLHDAIYDVRLTREVYRSITGLDLM